MNAIAPLPIDRRAERTHLFLVATLTFGRASVAVRVRNLSATGALIEAASLPPVGSTITLSRAGLEASGTIVWAESGKAGLTFSGFVDVSAWLPTKDAKRQVRIDPIAAEVQQAREVEVVAPPAATGPSSNAAIVAELVAIQAQISQLNAQFKRDVALMAQHPEAQLLEVAGQRIARIVSTLQKSSA